MQRRLVSTCFALLLVVALAQTRGLSLAQTTAPASTTPIASTPLPTTTGTPVSQNNASVPILEFRSYDCAWARFDNLNADGDPLLGDDETSKYAYRYVVASQSVSADALNEATSLTAQLQLLGINDIDEVAWDAASNTGSCDTKALSNYNSALTDTLCYPGASDMPEGLVFLVLYDLETLQIVGLTTVIDNRFGAATDLGCVATATPQTGGCGPYSVGQFLSPEEVAALGLTPAPSSNDDDDGQVTVYECVANASGQTYLVGQNLGTASYTPLPSPTPSRTPTRTPYPSREPTDKPRPTQPNVPQPTTAPTNTPQPTDTPVPPTNTPQPTDTPVPPTNTPQPTDTPVPPTNTPQPTDTPVPPTNTPQPTDTPVPPTNTPQPTDTPVPPTNTPQPTDTPVPPTNTPQPTNTPVPPTNTPQPTDPPTNTPTEGPTDQPN